MKLLRYGPPGLEKPGILATDRDIRDLSQIVPDISRGIIAPRSAEEIAKYRILALAQSCRSAPDWPVRWKRRKVHLYRPELFRSCRGIGDGCTCRTGCLHEGYVVNLRPRRWHCHSSGIEKTDWEVELGVVIGKPAKYRRRGGRIFVRCGILRDQ